MSWIVPVSEQERQQGELTRETAIAAARALDAQGAVILRGAMPVAIVDDLQAEFMARHGGQDLAMLAAAPPPNPVLDVGPGRFEILLRLEDPFGPAVYANPLLHGFMVTLLGHTVRLSGVTAVVSYPGAAMQHVHRDHGQLFSAYPTLHLPPYAINVSVPLIDVDLQTGPTGIWLGSHRWPDGTEAAMDRMTAVAFQRGDCILIDYRTLHTGLPNNSSALRPIVYMVYARTWFFDEGNHIDRISLDMTPQAYAALPDTVKPLLLRAHSQAQKARMLR